jgi:hypothetical protein
MSFSLASLLMFEDDVPAAARAALRAALRAPRGRQRIHLEAAAHSLYRDARLDCADARALVGLDD